MFRGVVELRLGEVRLSRSRFLRNFFFYKRTYLKK
jgi:hypothetical protein